MEVKLRKYFNKEVLYLFAMPVFFLLHGYNEIFGLIAIDVLAQLFFKYILITVIIVAISFLIIRDITNAAIFSFYLLCIYFFFGAFHEFLIARVGNNFFSSYSFVLPFIFFTTVLFLVLIKRSKAKLNYLMRYIKVLLVVITCLESGIFFYKLLTNQSHSNNLVDGSTGFTSAIKCDIEKPDIFFLVLDGYTSSECLKEEFNYDNSALDSILISNHFYISNGSKSNYNMTPLSLASTLNLGYLRRGLENTPLSPRFFLQTIETFKRNELVPFLAKQGYDIKNYGCLDMDYAGSSTEPLFQSLSYQAIDNQTFWTSVQKDISFNWRLKNIFTGQFKIPAEYKTAKEYHLFRNQFNFDKLLAELSTSNKAPRFVYVHLMLPHEPFYLNADGTFTSDTSIITQNLDMKTGYLGQVKYCNSLLKKLIPLVESSSNRNRVLIIEGDHGFRDYHSLAKRNDEFKNLNAYYFSDHDYGLLRNNISPVNSFRVVLNKYFCQKFELLKDSSIYLPHGSDIHK
jgi:hypothetical protein